MYNAMGNMKEKSIIFYRISHELFYSAMNHHCDKKFVQIVAIIMYMILGMIFYSFFTTGVSQYISFHLFEAVHLVHVIFYLIISSFRPVSILLTHVQETTVCTFFIISFCVFFLFFL